MATSAARTTTITYTGDVVGVQPVVAAINAASPGTMEIKTLVSGANTITPPAGGSTPVGVMIIPPLGNVVALTLKGVTGDTGVLLHPTDPTFIALGSPTATFCLTTSNTLTGIKFFWT